MEKSRYQVGKKTRKFNGETYQLKARSQTSGQKMEALAKKYRQQGRKARVVELMSGWHVYVR